MDKESVTGKYEKASPKRRPLIKARVAVSKGFLLIEHSFGISVETMKWCRRVLLCGTRKDHSENHSNKKENNDATTPTVGCDDTLFKCFSSFFYFCQ